MKLSVIIPFVNEYPQVAFTVAAIRNKLNAEQDNCAGYEWEIICVDNCTKQTPSRDKGFEYLKGLVEKWNPGFLVVDNYEEKQSCWGARNHGAKLASGDVFWFVDAHVMPSWALDIDDCLGLLEAKKFRDTVHVPLSYLNDAWGEELIYRARINQELGIAHYVFHRQASYRATDPHRMSVIEVPCMSTCGMFISRETWDEIQGYPPELGVYGGGENYLNYVLSVLGRKKWVLDHGRLEHYAEVRGYSWDGRDWLRNRMIAIYMAGGEDWLARCVRAIGEARRITHRQLRIMEEEILTNPGLIARRERIASMAVTTLEDWAEQWKGHELYEQPAEWM